MSESQQRELRFKVCRACGCSIDFDTGACGWECDHDGTRADDRRPTEVDIHVYRFDRIEAASRLPVAPPQEKE